jgi:predicted nuclease of restriction endonuclease-like (RecB) superfamily
VKISSAKYKYLLKEISTLVEQGRNNVVRHINTELLFTYWHVGRLIVEQEVKDKNNEQSTREMMIVLSKELTREVGRGFSRSNLVYMRLFYLNYKFVRTVSGQVQPMTGQTASDQKARKQKAGQTLSDQNLQTIFTELSWSHYNELLKISAPFERSFYQQQTILENWSVRELERQINSALFERIALSKNPKSVMKLALKGNVIKKDTDLTRDPYVLEFLNIPEHHSYSEKQLEQKIIDNLQKFILELGKGFTFVARQFRITLNNKHYRVDLVFYHRILKCFVLIDLKIKSVAHSDIGQMNMYLNYFETEQNTASDNQPIGIILSRHKNDITVEYAIRGITNKIFVSKYQLYLPDKKQLQRKVKSIIENN